MDHVVLELLKKQQEKMDSIQKLLSTTKNVLNMDDLSALTGLSKSHLYKLTAGMKIPHYKQSKHVYFDRQEIENWLKENKIKPLSEIEQNATSYVTVKNKGGAR